MDENTLRVIAALDAMRGLKSAANFGALGIMRFCERLPVYDAAAAEVPAGRKWLEQYQQNAVFRVGAVSGRSNHEVGVGLLRDFAALLAIVRQDIEADPPNHSALELLAAGPDGASLDELALRIDLESTPETGDDVFGVSLFDAILFLEDGDEQAAKVETKKVQDSKRQQPRVIGKCGKDRRVRLHLLPELVNFLTEVYALEMPVKRRLRDHLKSKQRPPAAQTVRK